MTVDLYLNDLGIINPLGCGKKTVATALFAGCTDGMITSQAYIPGETVKIGAVGQDLAAIDGPMAALDSRNNRLLMAALQQILPSVRAAIETYGAARIGVVLGTSTSSIVDVETAVAEKQRSGEFPPGYDVERLGLYHGADFVANALGVGGPVYAISTACTSSAKCLSSARRLIAADICDAVIVGGADSLCKLTLNGFRALEAISPLLCQPFSRNRAGINIGEGAALFLVSRDVGEVKLAGIGETSDAHHMSAPDPDGAGARSAMTAAIDDAGLVAPNIAYVNLHGTGTALNDAMEAGALDSMFPNGVACSSTKPLTGHMLGAAGANELAFIWLALQSEYANGYLPPHIWDGDKDPALADIDLVAPGRGPIAIAGNHMMSNSFAFGGNNISVVLSRNI